MDVTDELIDKLANLARLEIPEEEKPGIRDDLQRMIAFVEKINELDLDGVEPLLHMSPARNTLRDDVIKGSISREEALKNAPLHDERFFKVPKVIRN